MEAVVFMGIQGSGKSSFFKERFLSTHVHVSLDLLKTRKREQQLLNECFDALKSFVIDNTNPTRDERLNYIRAAKPLRFDVIGYYFQSKISDCLLRNSERSEAKRVPDLAILSTAKKLELPTWAEGFDHLYYVRLEDSQFVIEEWKDEV